MSAFLSSGLSVKLSVAKLAKIFDSQVESYSEQWKRVVAVGLKNCFGLKGSNKGEGRLKFFRRAHQSNPSTSDTSYCVDAVFVIEATLNQSQGEMRRVMR